MEFAFKKKRLQRGPRIDDVENQKSILRTGHERRRCSSMCRRTTSSQPPRTNLAPAMPEHREAAWVTGCTQTPRPTKLYFDDAASCCKF